MLDVLDAAAVAMIRDVVRSVNRNELILPGRGAWLLQFPPGTLFCHDITWLSGAPIHGSCWYDRDGFDLEVGTLGSKKADRQWYSIYPRAHFPDYVLWRVEYAPRDRNAQMRMSSLSDATLPRCPDYVESTIPARANDETP